MRKEYIEREAAIETFEQAFDNNWEVSGTLDRIRAIPTADVLEVVRCRECKHYNAGFECLIEGYGIERQADYFCADGERKEGGQELVPSADVVEVRHGSWAWDRWHEAYRCSCCDNYNADRTAYCPNCGARCDGGGHE